MLIPRKWQRMALDKWNDRPPKKRTKRGIHLMDSQREGKNFFCLRRCRIAAKAIGDWL